MHWLSKKSTKIIMIMPAVILFTVFYLAPIFISVYYSFTDFSGIGAAKFIGFKNYQVLLNDKFFFIALKNTFIILIGITITILPLSFIVALLLEKPFRGSGVVQSMIFAPNVIAPILVGLIWLFILDPKMGMINAILRSIGLSDYQQQWIGGKTLTPYSVAFVYLWQVLGFYTTINMAGLRSIPADIYEAAEIDGANYFQRIRKITIPMMKNTIVINTILIITGGFKIFETVKQLTNGGPNHMSDVLVTYMYDTTFTSSRYGYGMAVATVSFVLCLIFSIIYLVNVGKSLEQKEG
jgi:raffinose/stachyose/melibiose transport system permease protein